MTTLIERRLSRIEQRLGHRAPSRWTQVCAPPAISVADLREAIKTLIATAPDRAGDASEPEDREVADATG